MAKTYSVKVRATRVYDEVWTVTSAEPLDWETVEDIVKMGRRPEGVTCERESEEEDLDSYLSDRVTEIRDDETDEVLYED